MTSLIPATFTCLIPSFHLLHLTRKEGTKAHASEKDGEDRGAEAAEWVLAFGGAGEKARETLAFRVLHPRDVKSVFVEVWHLGERDERGKRETETETETEIEIERISLCRCGTSGREREERERQRERKENVRGCLGVRASVRGVRASVRGVREIYKRCKSTKIFACARLCGTRTSLLHLLYMGDADICTKCAGRLRIRIYLERERDRER